MGHFSERRDPHWLSWNKKKWCEKGKRLLEKLMDVRYNLLVHRQIDIFASLSCLTWLLKMWNSVKYCESDRKEAWHWHACEEWLRLSLRFTHYLRSVYLSDPPRHLCTLSFTLACHPNKHDLLISNTCTSGKERARIEITPMESKYILKSKRINNIKILQKIDDKFNIIHIRQCE